MISLLSSRCKQKQLAADPGTEKAGSSQLEVSSTLPSSAGPDGCLHLAASCRTLACPSTTLVCCMSARPLAPFWSSRFELYSGVQGREGGRGRGEYGGRGRGTPGHPDARGPPPGPTNILTHWDADASGFQEAGPAKSKGRFRGWETHTPATAPKVDHQVPCLP